MLHIVLLKFLRYLSPFDLVLKENRFGRDEIKIWPESILKKKTYAF
jgi:hypothetical protein